MKRGVLVAIVLGLALAQVAFWPLVRPLGVVPQILLAVMVLVALEAETTFGLVLAVVAGLVVDLASGANFGLWLGMMVLAVLVGAMVQRAGIEVNRLLVPTVGVVLGTILMDLIMWFSLAPIADRWPAGVLLGTLVAELGLNWIAMMALRPLVHWSADQPAGG